MKDGGVSPKILRENSKSPLGRHTMFISSRCPQHFEEAVPRCVHARLNAPCVVSKETKKRRGVWKHEKGK